MKKTHLVRIHCLCLIVGLGGLAAAAAAEAPGHQATGVKVGEVTSDTALIWVRRTAKADRNAEPAKPDFPRKMPADADVAALPGACPGAAGRVRVRYSLQEDLAEAVETAWAPVDEKTDFAHQFKLAGLRPATTYYFAAETADDKDAASEGAWRGRFRTAPRPDAAAEVRFTVITGQAYGDLDDRDGFLFYDGMASRDPHFIVPTGDTVYYDNDSPMATSVALARYHWHRIYSLPRLVRFHLHVPGYWEKDDHDTLSNDCWPGFKKQGELTFDEGLAIFREQVPMGEKTYRTFRWGRGLQVWLVEGRDFRSANNQPDGPEKTIWGPEQKKWFFDTVRASDADWKVLVSPTPLVGPDRANKGDNHANKAFAHEGKELRDWIAGNVPDNFFVCCGDRHWQYHSVHPESGVREFSCGPASDKHAGGTPGENEAYHRFHRVKGGFLLVSVSFNDGRSTIAFELCDVSGKTMHRFARTKGVKGGG